MAGTLSISLQCIYSLPIQDTSTRPQWEELDLVGGVLTRQTAVIEAQCWLIYGMEEEFNWKLARLERMMDPVGRSLWNPILIEDDPVKDVVVLVGHEE